MRDGRVSFFRGIGAIEEVASVALGSAVIWLLTSSFASVYSRLSTLGFFLFLPSMDFRSFDVFAESEFETPFPLAECQRGFEGSSNALKSQCIDFIAQCTDGHEAFCLCLHARFEVALRWCRRILFTGLLRLLVD